MDGQDVTTKPLGYSVRHLNQIELSRRWSISPRTLERWRWLGQGPSYLKIGGRVVYRLEEIEAFEAQQARLTAPVGHFPLCNQTITENRFGGDSRRGDR
jgi:hypothetical protein